MCDKILLSLILCLKDSGIYYDNEYFKIVMNKRFIIEKIS